MKENLLENYTVMVLSGLESAIMEARQLAEGTYVPPNGHISPLAPVGDALDQYKRILLLTKSMGPIIVSKLVNGVVGTVTWDDGNPELDQIDLKGLAEQLLKQMLFGSGCAAGVAYIHKETGEPRITVLSGMVIPIFDDFDQNYPDALYVTGTYRGLDKQRRMIRFYDLKKSGNGFVEMREWKDAKSLTDISGQMETYESMPPRWGVYGLDGDGYPYSMFMDGNEYLMDLLSVEMGKAKLREFAAYPVAVFRGADVQQVSVRTPVAVPLGGDFGWSDTAATMDTINREREIALEQVKLAFALPPSVGSGGQTPSGDSQIETKQHALQTWSRLADKLSVILSGLATDWLQLVRGGNVEPVSVTLKINTDAFKESEIGQTISLFSAGLLSLEAAVNHIAQFYDAWSTENVEEFIKSGGNAPAPTSPQDIQKILGE